MEPRAITCAEVDERHLEAAYLAGRLSAEDAEAFEAHFFACDRCWALVQQAAEVRAALTERPRTGAVRTTGARRGRLRRLVPLLAAAAVILAVELWLRPSASPPAAVYRGGDSSLRAVARVTTDSLGVSWERRAGAGTYRVRLFGADGRLLAERESADTALAVSRRAIPSGAHAYWEVDALDSLREIFARSPLILASPSDSTR